MSKKPVYQPPTAVDLGMPAVRGSKQPLGWCESGSNPGSFTCQFGFLPSQPAACSPTGSLPRWGGCSAGYWPDNPECHAGSLPSG